MKLVTSGIGLLGLREFVLRRIPAKLLPLRTLTQAVEDAAQGMTDEVSGMRIPVRPQQQDVRAFLDMPGPRAMQVPAFIVISGPQGIGKSAMLKRLACTPAPTGEMGAAHTSDFAAGRQA